MREGRIGARPKVRPTDRHGYTINEGGRSRHQRLGGLGRRFNPAKRLVPLSRLGWAATGSQCPLVDGLVKWIDDVTRKEWGGLRPPCRRGYGHWLVRSQPCVRQLAVTNPAKPFSHFRAVMKHGAN